MRELTDFNLVPADNGGAATLAFSGPMTVASLGAADTRLRNLSDSFNEIDISGVTRIDTVGAWTVWRLSRDHDAKITGCSDEAQKLVDAISKADSNAEDVRAPRLPLLTRVPAHVGEVMIDLGRGMLQVVGFLGQIILSAGTLIRHPGRFRMKALVHQMELVGVNSLAIIGLMSFLVGIVIAQQGAVQLRQFGAEIYIVNLVGRLTLREL
ncbi:MAG: ABC transporter permease, partial [Novosphingobium sp. 35-62-5]